MRISLRAILGTIALAAAVAACAPTDSGVSTKVKQNLTADATLKDYQIDVGVQNRVVTLSGTVNAPGDKERVVTVARGTAGVTDVVDHVVVKDQAPGPGPGYGYGYGHEMMQKGMAEGKDHAEQDKPQ